MKAIEIRMPAHVFVNYPGTVIILFSTIADKKDGVWVGMNKKTAKPQQSGANAVIDMVSQLVPFNKTFQN